MSIESEPREALIETLKEAANLAGAVGGSIAEEFPMISLLFSASNAIGTYQKRVLLRNVEAFIREVGSKDKKLKLIEKLYLNEEFANEFSDIVFYIIQNSSKPLKAKLVAKLAIGLADGFIREEDFLTLSHIIESASMAALNALEKYLDENKPAIHRRVDSEPLLLSMGIAHRNGTMFSISNLGQQLYKIGFGKPLK